LYTPIRGVHPGWLVQNQVRITRHLEYAPASVSFPYPSKFPPPPRASRPSPSKPLLPRKSQRPPLGSLAGLCKLCPQVQSHAPPYPQPHSLAHATDTSRGRAGLKKTRRSLSPLPRTFSPHRCTRLHESQRRQFDAARSLSSPSLSGINSGWSSQVSPSRGSLPCCLLPVFAHCADLSRPHGSP
jgi:hypothetical protein